MSEHEGGKKKSSQHGIKKKTFVSSLHTLHTHARAHIHTHIHTYIYGVDIARLDTESHGLCGGCAASKSCRSLSVFVWKASVSSDQTAG